MPCCCSRCSHTISRKNDKFNHTVVMEISETNIDICYSSSALTCLIPDISMRGTSSSLEEYDNFLATAGNKAARDQNIGISYTIH